MQIIHAGLMPAYVRAGGMRPFLTMCFMQKWGLRPRWEPRGVVEARINHSRWIADCPFCRGAVTLDHDDPVFFCIECGMQANGGGPSQPGYAMRVVWPTNRAELEAVLLQRPDPATRNWFPHETLADLIRENIAHGVPV